MNNLRLVLSALLVSLAAVGCAAETGEPEPASGAAEGQAGASTEPAAPEHVGEATEALSSYCEACVRAGGVCVPIIAFPHWACE